VKTMVGSRCSGASQVPASNRAKDDLSHVESAARSETAAVEVTGSLVVELERSCWSGWRESNPRKQLGRLPDQLI
jgi:hypothetical protein